MYNRMNAIIISTVVLLTIVFALIACMFGTQNTIQTIDGVRMVRTENGTMHKVNSEDFDLGLFGTVTYEYASYRIATPVYNQVIVTTNNNTPVTLPNTSAPHGTHTCDMGKYTVTTDQNCSDLK